MTRTDPVLDPAKGLTVKDSATICQNELEKLNAAIHLFETAQADATRMNCEKSDELYYELMVRYLKECRDARLSGKPLVFVRTSTAALPILHAMDLVSYPITALADLLSPAQGSPQEFLDGATEAGLRPWLCQSTARYPWGGVVRGHIQPPDLVVSNHIDCNTTSIGMEFWVSSLGIPRFCLDRPMKYGEHAVQVYAKQLRHLIAWLEEQTGHKMDWDKLEASVGYHRQYLALQREICELRKAVPHPLRTKQTYQMSTMGVLWGGRPERVQFNEMLRDEVKMRVEQKRGCIDNERLRLLTLRVPGFAFGILDWWEREWGAVSVVEPRISSREVEVDPQKPLESLARVEFYARGECNLMATAGDEFIEGFVWLAKEYSVDGAVYLQPHWCRNVSPLSQAIRHALKKEAGVPTLVIDVDYVDPTYISEEGIRDKMEPFFEMLIDRKGF